MRRHLRTLLRVRDEGGRFLLFRFYDPRILRVYLPTVTPEEARRVAGPLLELACESEDGHHLELWKFDGRRFNHRREQVRPFFVPDLTATPEAPEPF